MISGEDAKAQIKRLGCLGVSYNGMNSEGFKEIMVALADSTSPHMASQIIGDWIESGESEMPKVAWIRAQIAAARAPKPRCQHCEEGSGWVMVERNGLRAATPCPACRVKGEA